MRLAVSGFDGAGNDEAKAALCALPGAAGAGPHPPSTVYPEGS